MQCEYEMMIKKSLAYLQTSPVAISKIKMLNIKKAITIPLNHMQKQLHMSVVGRE